jgi:sterol desaturase/sphingolipid hydroxylase (fatty acid hydroxylase superfamily)
MTAGLFMLVVALVTAALAGAEYARGVRGTDWQNNLAAWALQFLAAALFFPLIPLWQGHGLIDGAAFPFWLAFPLYLVVQDLGEYLFHRAQHRIPALWAMHALHHSDPNMSVLTTQRHFWGDQLVKRLTVWSAAAFIVSPTPELHGAYLLAGLWNLVVHSKLPIDFGRWSWLLNSPSYHRRHHSSKTAHYDSNFAALLPVFDVIAGSYHRGEGMPPTGLDRQPRSFAEVAAWPLLVSGLWKPGKRTKPAGPAAP